MLSIGYGVDQGCEKISMRNNEIELLMGNVGSGKSYELAMFLKNFKNNALLISNCGCDRDLLKGTTIIKLTKDNYKSEMEEAIKVLKSNTVILEIYEAHSEWFINAIGYISEEIKKYFIQSKCEGFFGVDDLHISSDVLIEICNSGTIVKIATLINDSHYTDFYNKFEYRIKKTVPISMKVGNFSGNISLRIPKSLHAKLHSAAALEGVSLNQYIMYVLANNIKSF